MEIIIIGLAAVAAVQTVAQVVTEEMAAAAEEQVNLLQLQMVEQE
jgi:hypothetical protein